MNKKMFSQFSGLYELSKTLRFELRPVGKTKELLNSMRDKNQIFKNDKEIFQSYLETKKYLDRLHREFVENALMDLKIGFGKYFSLFKKFKLENNKENRENLSGEEKKLRMEIVEKGFNKKGQEWKEHFSKKYKFQKDGYKILMDKGVFDILAEKYPDGKTHFKKFKNFTTYFTNFHTSRENFYSDKNKASAIANRIINENLRKFCENKIVFEDRYTDLNLLKEEKDIFDLDFYGTYFLQSGIEYYNKIVGEINKKVNSYNQGLKKDEKKKKLPMLKILFKQILAEVIRGTTEQDNFIELESESDVFEVLTKFVEYTKENNQKIKKLFDKFITGDFDDSLDKIFISAKAVNTISNRWFQSWAWFGEELLNYFNKGLSASKQKKNLPDFVSIADIKNVLENLGTEKENPFRDGYLKQISQDGNSFHSFLAIWKLELDTSFNGTRNVKGEILELGFNKSLARAEKMISEDKFFSNKKGVLRNGGKGDIQKEIIKDFADSALSIYQIMKYFSLQKGKNFVTDLDECPEFYNPYNEWLEDNKTFLYYNEFRNFLTRKPYRQEKIKLNFENGSLLDGWDKNKEADNFGVILRKNKKYYLGVMSKNHNQIFSDTNKKLFSVEGKDFYEKMVYKFLPDPKKMLPKVCFSKRNKKLFEPSEGIIKIKEKEEFKKGDNFKADSLNKMINFYKQALIKYPDWQTFNFITLKETTDYRNIGEFYRDIEKNSYKVWFEKVSQKYIEEKVASSELYLFEIHNKDWAEGRNANSKKNLHTIYWENLFTEENQHNPIFKLNGKAEIFFRESSLAKEKEKRKNPREIIKFKRYTEDKILFHCPIKLNFACHDEKVNDKIKDYIKESDKIRIIGIDRGEKHLLYISVVGLNGEPIVGQTRSLNVINGVDYQKKLHELEKERDKARKSWQIISNIKEMKLGYVSQAVNEINKIIFDILDAGYLPMIVFEDLNLGFKRGRFKIEKQVYQNFELALAKKLNYLVSKKKENYTEAYQLTPPIRDFQDINKHTGNILYIPASFTSAICPRCGFRKRLYKFVYTNEEQFKKYLKEHNFKISWDGKRFNFECDASQDNKNKKENKNELFSDVKLNERLVFNSDVERLRYKRSKDNRSGETEKYHISTELKKLFEDNGIELNHEIDKQIIERNFKSDFYKSLIFFVNLILKLRNSHSERNTDYISCPSCGFNSDNGFKNIQNFNGDANGAFNIARKGVLMVLKIKQFLTNKESGDLKFEHMVIQNQEWDKFLQEQNKK